MNGNYRGGNSRQLAKLLDACPWPVAWLLNDGEIVFVNAAMCEIAAADATELVGTKCAWQLPPDGQKHAPLLIALAPPLSVLNGQAVVRQVPWPPASPTGQIQQHFVPLSQFDTPGYSCLVMHNAGNNAAAPTTKTVHRDVTLQSTDWLIRLRSHWAQLDGLLPLCGNSPAAQVAMRRVQLAIGNSESLFISGPQGVGKSDILRAIFAGRLKLAGISMAEGRFFPIDCENVDVPLLEDMLDVFQSLISHQVPPAAQHLVLERIDLANEQVIGALERWLASCSFSYSLSATSHSTAIEMGMRGERWRSLVGRLGTIDINVPSLASRREDISVLVQQALAAACNRAQRPQLTISAAAMDLLTAYHWPDNLTEVQKFATEVVGHVTAAGAIQPQHLPLAIRTFGSTVLGKQSVVEPIDLDKVLADLERTMIERAIKLSPRNRAQAARSLGISRPRLLRRIVELGLDTEPDSESDNSD